MPRTPKDSTRKKSSRLQLEKLYRICRYCNTNRPTNRFDKHQKACKTRWEIHKQRKTTKATHIELETIKGSSSEYFIRSNELEFVQGSSAMLVDTMVNDLPVLSSDLDNRATEQIGECHCISWVMLGSKIIGNV